MGLDYIHKTSSRIEALIVFQNLYAAFRVALMLLKIRFRKSKQSLFGKVYVIDPQTSQNVVIS